MGVIAGNIIAAIPIVIPGGGNGGPGGPTGGPGN